VEAAGRVEDGSLDELRAQAPALECLGDLGVDEDPLRVPVAELGEPGELAVDSDLVAVVGSFDRGVCHLRLRG
jgi:hypothetical protein